MTGDSEPAVWINGRRQTAEGAHLSARDRGFTLADGVFETMRAVNGTVFRLERHLARLSHALEVLDIGVPRELHAWVQEGEVGDVLTASFRDAAVRLTVTRGPGAGGVPPPAEVHPTVVVTVSARPALDAAISEAGLTAHVASGRLNERSMTAGLKTVAYTDRVVAWLEARRAGADEALFLNTGAHCAEATSSNLFIVTGGALVTPPLTSGVLPGITREAVLGLASAIGVTATERSFRLDALLDADEAFLTSSLRGIAPLVRVGSRSIGQGRPGGVTRRVADAYRALVAEECCRDR